MLIPEAHCGRLWLFAQVHVQDLRVDPSGRYLLLRRVCEGRGYTPWSDILVFDSQSKKTIYDERFEPTSEIASIAIAANGDLGVAVHDIGLCQQRM